MKIVVYTCITNNYDNLVEPTYIDNSLTYLAFVSNDEIKSSVWQIKKIDIDQELGPVKTARKIKILAHKYLSEYDCSIWIDGTIDVIGDVKSLVNSLGFPLFVGFKHPFRNCIYSEGKACIKHNKDKKEIINEQLSDYRKEGYPVNAGLIESNVLIRMHNSPSVIKLMEFWWQEVRNKSRRDQLSFNYSVWKTESHFVQIINENARDSFDYFLMRCNGLHRGEQLFSRSFSILIKKTRNFVINFFKSEKF